MAWFPRLWSRKEATMTSLDLYREILGSASARSGVAVTHQTALQATAAFACARVIAEGLMQVPFRVMQFDGKNRLPAADHPLYKLFEAGPNEVQTTAEFLETLGFHLVFTGNAFVWKNFYKGQIAELLTFTPNQVTVKHENWATRYWVSVDGQQQEIPAAEMWHIRGPSWNGYMGLDAVRLAREAIGLSLAAEGHGASTFGNGANVSGILTTDKALTKEQRDLLRKSFMEAHAGKNAGGVAVMSNGMSFQAMSQKNVDAQWIEGRNHQIEEICRAFRVLPIMVGYSDKTATYASAEQMFIAHSTYTLGPWYKRLEDSAKKFLLTEQDRAAGIYPKFFAQGLMRGAVKDRGEYYRALYAIGALNPNEIRELEDRNPYEGGDQYRVPMNTEDPNAPKGDQGNANGTN